MVYCIVCKEMTEKRFSLELKDSKNSVGINAHVCRECFSRFLSSHANEGPFKIARFLGWAKHKDDARV